MQAEFGPRLAVDYGASSTVAVLVWPDGHWWALSIDDATVLTSAVYVESAGHLVPGARAWQLGQQNPDRLITSPVRAGMGSVVVDGIEVVVQDAVAATLRLVADEAARIAGTAISDVSLVVPAGWGPKRRTWMRQSAYRAGLGQPTLVEAPVAAAQQVLTQGVQLPVGAFVLVCDAGAGFEATVLRRGPAGFEVLSTLADTDAGGDRVDVLLAEAMVVADKTAGQAELAGSDMALVRANARVAKEILTRTAAVTVPMPPPHPAVVVTATMLAGATEPVIQRAVGVCEQAVSAAELTVDQLAGVYVVGGSAQLPGFAEAIEGRLGVRPAIASEPALVAVFGAARAGGPVTAPSSTPREHALPLVTAPLPSLRRVAAMAIPGVASLALIAHFLFTVGYSLGSRTYRTPYSYVLANWGELGTACVMALLGCLAAGSVLATLTAGLERAPSRTPAVEPAAQIATGILTAAAIGASIAGLYAVLGAFYINTDIDSLLRWSLLPIAPVLVAAVLVAVAAARLRRAPVQGWDAFLAFPVSSVLTASLGTLMVQQSMKNAQLELVGRFGGMLIGAGIACALVSRWILRIIVALPLAVVMAAIVSWPGTGILAGIYAVAVAVWWTARLWTLLRSPVTTVSASVPGPPVGAWPGR